MGDLPGAGQSKGAVRNRKKFLMIAGGALVAAMVAAGIWAANTSASPQRAANGTAASSATSQSAASQSGAPPSTAGAKETVPPVSIPKPAPVSKAEASAKAKEEKVLAAIPQPVAPSVAIGQVSKPQGGVTAVIGAIAAVQGKAQGPGEVSGPAVRFTVTLANGGATALNTGMVVVNVDGGPDHVPALVLSGPGAVDFPASLAPGQKASGTFVYLIPNNQRDEVRIFFNYNVSSSIVAFSGAVPKAQG